MSKEEDFKLYQLADDVNITHKAACSSVEWVIGGRSVRCTFLVVGLAGDDMQVSFDIHKDDWRGQYIVGYLYNISINSTKNEII